jgi:hypothetical protein
MKSPHCVFDRLNMADMITVPFPHVVIENAFDQSTMAQLIANRPSLECFIRGSVAVPGEKLHIPSRSSLSDGSVHELWRQVIRCHLDSDNIRLWLNAFAVAIRTQYPDLERRLGPFEHWRIGQRGVDSPEEFEALVDAQISLHNACPGTTAQERGAHVKITNKLLIVQCMLRLPEDDDPGAEFELYETEPGARLLFGPQQQVVNKHRIRLAKRIPYEAGTAIAFLNSPAALQTMAPRSNCPHPTFYFNIILETAAPLFSLPSFLPTTTGK